MIPFGNTANLLSTQNSDNMAFNLKAKTVQRTSDSDFKSVFDKSFNNTSKRASNNEISKNNNDFSGKSEANLRYKSFRDIQQNRVSSESHVSTRRAAGNTKANEDITETKETKKNSSNSYDDQVNVLAQMMGLSPNDLVKLAKQLGFSEEDMADAKKLTAFMDKLGGLLQLSGSQQEVLNNLVQEISKQLKSENLATDLKADGNGNQDEIVNVQKNAETLDISKLAAELKAKLDSLIQTGKTNAASISEEISRAIAAMKAQSQNKLSVSTEGTVSQGLQSPGEQEIQGKSVQGKEVENAKVTIQEDESGKTHAVTATETKNVSVDVRTDGDPNQDQQNLQTLGEIKAAIANNQTPVEKAKFTMPQQVKTSEIVNQVVEQAKVILGQDKTEMVIQMKPEHLGKLELKIVTEQGIVAAKFIAENQQVKEIIETNMQLLKDSLQKQGISIDGVSVQVGQDSKGEFNQQNTYESRNNGSSRRNGFGTSSTGVASVGINTLDTLPDRLAQYSDDANTINLTA